ncbi:hypothetical protein A4X09_0g6727 [Tilletia walkeri]|uniref:Uncharacterized protein n=1 Tax=Tilletia walkeri TaxID=117179 RepID=A0A8X7N4V1_9BASI|nr:hypothetical protein A4X09_0g6727 [Tilletia walkeri]
MRPRRPVVAATIIPTYASVGAARRAATSDTNESRRHPISGSIRRAAKERRLDYTIASSFDSTPSDCNHVSLRQARPLPRHLLNVWSVVATLVLHVNFQSLDGNAVRIVNERVYHLRAITPQPPPSCSTKSPFTSLLLLTVAPYPTISPLFTSAVLAVFVFVDIPVHMERVLSDLWNATISATTVIGAMAYNQRGRDAQK